MSFDNYCFEAARLSDNLESWQSVSQNHNPKGQATSKKGPQNYSNEHRQWHFGSGGGFVKIIGTIDMGANDENFCYEPT